MAKSNKDKISLSLEIERGDNDAEFQSFQPTTSTYRPGSRAPSSRASSSSSSYRRPANTGLYPGQIQILSDSYGDEEDEYGAMVLEEYRTDDSSEESDSTLADSPGADYRQHSYLLQRDRKVSHPSEMQLQRLSSATSTVEIDSDEENEIVNRIKAEITHQVKNEVKDELLQLPYQSSGEPTADDDEDLDPMIKAALLQMRKYDRILEKRTKKEREVKRQRIALQHRLREELADLRESSSTTSRRTKDEITNTEKFLSLPTTMPQYDRHLNEDHDDFVSEPVFHTQPPEFKQQNKNHRKTKSEGASLAGHSETTDQTEYDSQSTTSTNQTSDTLNSKGKRRRRKNSEQGKKDFIQRNIDLAADAGNAVAMTDDEKNRLNGLLKNIDEYPEVEHGIEEASDSAVLLRAAVGEGYIYDADEKRSITDIDNQLKHLLGQEEFDRSLPPPEQVSYESLEFFSRHHSSRPEPTNHVMHGEKVLNETKQHRDLKLRLADIEQELGDLSHAVTAEIESPRLTSEQLQTLLDECTQTLSRATLETNTITASSPRTEIATARSELLENLPKLDRSTLDGLLAQARSEGIKSRSQSRAEVDQESSEVYEGADTETAGQRPESSLISGEQMKELLTNLRSTSTLPPKDLEQNSNDATTNDSW